jgi:hypothetical protein
VRDLNTLAATITTPIAVPVVAATQLCGGKATSARGTASFATQSVTTARAAGYSGTIVVRMDSAFYGAPVIGAIRRAGACFFGSRCGRTSRCGPRSPRLAPTPGQPSSTRAPCGTTSCGPAYRRPRSPKCRIRRLPRRSAGHRPADRAPGERTTAPRPAIRASCSRCGDITRCSPTFPLPRCKPSSSTVTTPSWSRCSRTGLAGHCPPREQIEDNLARARGHERPDMDVASQKRVSAEHREHVLGGLVGT